MFHEMSEAVAKTYQRNRLFLREIIMLETQVNCIWYFVFYGKVCSSFMATIF